LLSLPGAQLNVFVASLQAQLTKQNFQLSSRKLHAAQLELDEALNVDWRGDLDVPEKAR